MEFNPDTWGTVADWVGGLGTTAAFIAAVVVIAKDAKVRKIAQARKVVYVAENKTVYRTTDAIGNTPPEEVTHYILKNLSDEPIYGVQFHGHRHGALRVNQVFAKTRVILPQESFSYEAELDQQAPLVAFRDNSGEPWIRTEGGKVYHRHQAYFARDDPSDS